jgi:pimeloyl-ACP methyl ester carboxylesterase
MTRGRFLPLRAVQVDPRFSWCGYVPAGQAESTVVLVHGSDRDPVGMVRAFQEWADRTRVALLAPLFPGGIPHRDDMDAYKSVLDADVAHDHILDAALADAVDHHAFPAGTFALLGFSGGAQFAHRYTLLHPRGVRALALIAPGNVTLLSSGRAWWVGVEDVADRTGSPVDRKALRHVPALAMVGSEDDGREFIHIEPSERRWVEGANDAGISRVDRLATLVTDWRSAGLPVEHVVLSGVGHDFMPFVPLVQDFFDAQLRCDAPDDGGDPHA